MQQSFLLRALVSWLDYIQPRHECRLCHPPQTEKLAGQDSFERLLYREAAEMLLLNCKGMISLS